MKLNCGGYDNFYFLGSVLLQLLYLGALANSCVVEDVSGFLMILFVCNEEVFEQSFYPALCIKCTRALFHTITQT